MPTTHRSAQHPGPASVSTGRPRDLARPLPAGLSWAVLIAFCVALVATCSLGILPLWIAAIYLGLSLVAFAAYGLDKRAARLGASRTSEDTLLLVGILGGWPGAVVGQQAFRHKTRKRSFRRKFWATVVVNIVAVTAFIVVAQRQGWDVTSLTSVLLGVLGGF